MLWTRSWALILLYRRLTIAVLCRNREQISISLIKDNLTEMLIQVRKTTIKLLEAVNLQPTQDSKVEALLKNPFLIILSHPLLSNHSSLLQGKTINSLMGTNWWTINLLNLAISFIREVTKALSHPSLPCRIYPSLSKILPNSFLAAEMRAEGFATQPWWRETLWKLWVTSPLRHPPRLSSKMWEEAAADRATVPTATINLSSFP